MKTIDYEAARKEHPRLKAELTRAKNSGNPIRVLNAVEHAYDRFDAWGAWPDGWALWRVALIDARWELLRADEGVYSPKALERFDKALSR